MEKKINVFVVAFPSMDDVISKIKDAVEDAFEKPKTVARHFCHEDEEDFTPRNLRVDEPRGGVEPWGIRGRMVSGRSFSCIYVSIR